MNVSLQISSYETLEFKVAEIGNVSRCHANKSHKADGIMSVINTVKKVCNTIRHRTEYMT